MGDIAKSCASNPTWIREMLAACPSWIDARALLAMVRGGENITREEFVRGRDRHYMMHTFRAKDFRA